MKTASIFDYSPPVKDLKPESRHPLDGHYIVVNNKEVWIPRRKK